MVDEPKGRSALDPACWGPNIAHILLAADVARAGVVKPPSL